MKKILIIAATAFSAALSASGAPCVRFNNIGSDTLKINSILAEAVPMKLNSDRIIRIARGFVDTPYQANTLNGDEECLTVNLDGFDCTTFVETVLALNSAAADKRISWRDFLGALESLRYRSGILDGYASRLHYVSDWAVDNIHRGNFREVTGLMPRGLSDTTRSLDFMSTHSEAYPQLSDPAQLALIKAMERNFRNFRFSYLRSADVRHREVSDAFRPGDVVAMVTKKKGLDVTHMGIIDKDPDGTLRLIHASSASGKVMVDELPLTEYLRKHPSTIGLRIFRVVTN